MYRSSKEAWDGLAKNLFAAFGFRILPYLFVWSWLTLVFVLPILDLGLYVSGVAPQVPPRLTVVCVGLSVGLWVVPYARLRLPVYLGLAYPINMIVVTLVAMRSLWKAWAGQLVWKGRRLEAPRLRLI
jgi:hypothetical protein